MISEEENVIVPLLRPSVIVSFNSVFGSVKLNGDICTSPDVVDLINSFKGKGYYILIDCHDCLYKCMVRLRTHNVHYDGLTRDSLYGQPRPEERFIERVSSHVGNGAIQAVIDEDISVLDVCARAGISTYQIMCGSLISQASNGRERFDKRLYNEAYQAGVGSIG